MAAIGGRTQCESHGFILNIDDVEFIINDLCINQSIYKYIFLPFLL